MGVMTRAIVAAEILVRYETGLGNDAAYLYLVAIKMVGNNKGESKWKH